MPVDVRLPTDAGQSAYAKFHRRAIDWERWCVDGTSIRALVAAAGARKKRETLPNLLTTLWADLGAAGGRSFTSRATGGARSRRSA